MSDAELKRTEECYREISTVIRLPKSGDKRQAIIEAIQDVAATGYDSWACATEIIDAIGAERRGNRPIISDIIKKHMRLETQQP